MNFLHSWLLWLLRYLCNKDLCLSICLSRSELCHIFWPTSQSHRSNPSTYLESSDHGGCYKTICSCLSSKINKFCQWQPFSKLWKNCHSEHVLPTHVISNNVLPTYVIPNTSEQRGRRRQPICESFKSFLIIEVLLQKVGFML